MDMVEREGGTEVEDAQRATLFGKYVERMNVRLLSPTYPCHVYCVDRVDVTPKMEKLMG